MGKGNVQVQQKQKLKQKPKQKSELSYNGQPKVRVELSPHRVNGCSTSEFLAWIRQQEGESGYAK